MHKILLILLLMCSSFGSFSQSLSRADAKRIIFKTNRVIGFAHDQLKENKNFTGNFSQSYAHQRASIRYFKRQRYEKAVNHTVYARDLASKSIRDNIGIAPEEATFNSEEKGFLINDEEGKVQLKNDLKELKIETLTESLYVDNEIDLRIESTKKIKWRQY